jgi:hypothetical protein
VNDNKEILFQGTVLPAMTNLPTQFSESYTIKTVLLKNEKIRLFTTHNYTSDGSSQAYHEPRLLLLS